MRCVPPLDMQVFTLVPVGALFPVGARLSRLRGDSLDSQEVVQRWPVPAQRVVGRHEPGEKYLCELLPSSEIDTGESLFLCRRDGLIDCDFKFDNLFTNCFGFFNQ